ncbi:MAG: ATP-binding protein [Patescibacteria group bacterium]
MKYIHRSLESQVISILSSGKVLVLVGARQVGKTTLIQNIVKDTRHTFLNMDRTIDANRLHTASLLSPEEAMRTLGNPNTLVIDEAQRIPQVGRIVKGWFDSNIQCKIILLGSSSLQLLDHTAEPLTGRNLKCILPPLSIKEALTTQSWFDTHIPTSITTKTYHAQLHDFLLQRMTYGSYPESVQHTSPTAYLHNLVEDYLFKDIYSLGLTRSPQTLQKLVQLLALQIGSEVSINELSSSLGISRTTVERYLDLLEQTFVIFRIRPYFTNARKELIKNYKIYFWDTGVRNAIIGQLEPREDRVDIGPLWENWVFSEWKKKLSNAQRPTSLHFWRTRQGSEVDMVIKQESKLTAFECKWSTKKDTRKSLFSSDYGVPVTPMNPETIWAHLL